MSDIQLLQQKADDVFKSLQVAFKEVEELDQQREGVEIYEREVRDLEKSVLKKEEKNRQDRSYLDAEKEVIARKRIELVEYEKRLDKSKQQIIAAKENIKLMDSKILEMKQEEVRLEAKRKEIEALQPRLDEIERKEALIKKEQESLRQKSEILGKRQERIEVREKQLQLEAAL